ncbi:MAG TPA: filamentous hemagglutinin N-terminal domain-containing protein, partial [Alphaproteobacteria bacterium]|nr:filamentous hemagglutinin N-terminal domain-containing protein [Alphaproteobacteria bacterium]
MAPPLVAVRRRPHAQLKALLLVTTLLTPSAALAQVASNALPSGANVASGQVTLSQSGSTLDVNQASSRAIINWQSFNIGSQAKVDFNQPSSSAVALNRVLGGSIAQIYGQLHANGQIFLLDPAGVIFGAGASVNVGALVASTMSITDANFLAGNYVFQRNGSTGSVVNYGTLTAAAGGYIGLLAPEVINQGVISAQLGTVALAAGEKVTLDFSGQGLVGIAVDPATVKALIENHNLIAAPDGRVLMSAQAASSLLGGVINNTGVIEANSLVSHGGVVSLEASDSINLAGTIDVSGATAGGTASVSAASITLAGAAINATGPSGGGVIAIGNFAASSVSMDAASSLDASATGSGPGGTVSVISGGVTTVAGKIAARGGPQGGDGGEVETSGATLNLGALAVDTTAPMGKTGTWLLDPSDVTISSSPDSNETLVGNTYTPTSGATTSNISATELATNLATTNVTITTTNAGTSGNAAGTIAVNAPVSWSSGNTLTLNAAGSITVSASISATAAAGSATGGTASASAGSASSTSGGTASASTGSATSSTGGTASASTGSASSSAGGTASASKGSATSSTGGTASASTGSASSSSGGTASASTGSASSSSGGTASASTGSASSATGGTA